MNEKAKRDYYPRTFFPIWLFYTVLVYPLSGILIVPFMIFTMGIGLGIFGDVVGIQNKIFLNTISLSGVGAAIGLALGLLQKDRLHHYFGWSAMYWRRASLLGGGLGIAVLTIFSMGMESFAIFEPYPNKFMPYQLILPMPTFITCVALSQWFVLRQTVQRAWYWVAANLLGGIWFGASLGMWQELFHINLLLIGMPIVAVLGQGLITGMALKFLFAQHTKLELSKNGF